MIEIRLFHALAKSEAQVSTFKSHDFTGLHLQKEMMADFFQKWGAQLSDKVKKRHCVQSVRFPKK